MHLFDFIIIILKFKKFLTNFAIKKDLIIKRNCNILHII